MRNAEQVDGGDELAAVSDVDGGTGSERVDDEDACREG